MTGYSAAELFRGRCSSLFRAGTGQARALPCSVCHEQPDWFSQHTPLSSPGRIFLTQQVWAAGAASQDNAEGNLFAQVVERAGCLVFFRVHQERQV